MFVRARLVKDAGHPTHSLTSYYRPEDVDGTPLVDPEPGPADRGGGFAVLTMQVGLHLPDSRLMPHVTEQDLDNPQILWDYHRLHHELRPTDVDIGLGSHDLGVAIHAANLYRQGWFPLIVFTGANAPTTIDRFPEGEAVHYAREAIARGVPADRIRVEPNATNTGENITLTRDLLAAEGIHPRSATLVTRPYQQRRAYATARRLWPQVDFIGSAQPLGFRTYLAEIGDQAKVLNMLVGDTQRIWVYADRGFAISQALPADVRQAYERLCAADFTARLL